MKRLAALIAVVATLIPMAALAATWWNNDWKYRKEISLDLSATGADVAGTPLDVPVLIRLSLANFSYFNDTKPDGSDFRIVAGDDKTPLKFHFEKYDVQNQMALLWVRVPQITGGSKSDKIYAYYGNADAPNAADAPGTYDAAEVLVLPMSESSGTPQDLTAYKTNPSASNAGLTPASLIGGGAKFSGKETIAVPASASLRLLPNQGLTMSAWLRIEKAQQATILALADQGKFVELSIDGSKMVARAALDGAPATATQPTDLSLNQWHHVALTVGSGKLTLYVDGLATASAPITLAELGGTLRIGSAAGKAFLTGARAQGMDANLVVYGPDGQKEGGSQASYFGTIAKNLTIDGWVVIGICMAMLAVSLLIMVFKAIFLARVERANARFLREFRRLSGDPTVLDKPSTSSEEQDLIAAAPSMAELAKDQNKYGASTLYRLYHHGVFELNKRIGGQTVSAQRVKTLSPQSMDAIRAAMDSSMTRLDRKSTRQMVLLTIAISGGPFLGLLGTVIGVMITFAAIALSGDVNVNAIAPGTAAALAATVAGLAVAIPSLFVYNWLNTRIKAITADNRVFVDEFVTRVAEQYS